MEVETVRHFVLPSKDLAAVAALVPIVSREGKGKGRIGSGLLPPWEVGMEVEEERNRDFPIF